MHYFGTGYAPLLLLANRYTTHNGTDASSRLAAQWLIVMYSSLLCSKEAMAK